MGACATAQAPFNGNSVQLEKVLTRVPRDDESAADLAYWLSRPVAERLAAVKVLRQQAFAVANAGSDPSPDAEPRLEKVWRIVQRYRR